LKSKKEIAMASRWNGVTKILFSKAAAGVTACLGAAIVLGCMNISLGGHSAAVAVPMVEEQGAFEQVGRLPVRCGPEQVVFYAVPFTSPPNLEIEDPSAQCDIVDQKENCFKVRFHANVTSSPQTLSWKARGTRAPQAVSAAPAPAAAEVQPTPPAPPAPPTLVPVSNIVAPQE
jgi:hypothetical protein